MSDPTGDTTPFGGPQGSRRVLFGSVFDALSGPGGNGNHDGNGGTIGSRTVPVQPQCTSTFNLGIKPKEPPVFYRRANEDVSTWVAKALRFLLLDKSHSTTVGSLRSYPPSGGCCRLVGCPATRTLWSTS